MHLNNLSSLYREVILDHAQHPHNRKKLENPSGQMELLNPTCGDAIMVQWTSEDNLIKEVAFEGYGCSISIASASLMTDALMGKSIEQAIQLINTFNTLITSTEEISDSLLNELGDAVLLEGIQQFPARYKCAILAWRAIEYGINGQHQNTRRANLD
ncbi:Fe-S cluster assembly sulfur transfer protein SufU [Fundicoccus culcitae]|uniref:SUF system NifU family Fe-S cluster assembly protein n=1 Tax=Fundicoccus culcitae TaxID=2969821 RepID=A0ABY5P6B4_9LACT|nr:SUF system NifU family Fe-S cluster assembly protein [Fundicoccus culcitae]UUX34150.1 SUF system NifU family Fe-S cluster assembly protein [Fundicoccus culcitae]